MWCWYGCEMVWMLIIEYCVYVMGDLEMCVCILCELWLDVVVWLCG